MRVVLPGFKLGDLVQHVREGVRSEIVALTGNTVILADPRSIRPCKVSFHEFAKDWVEVGGRA